MANQVWRCSCGQEWPEDGTGVAQSQAWRHLMETKWILKTSVRLSEGEALTTRGERLAREYNLTGKPGEYPEHSAIGLVDLDTGDILLHSFSAVAAQLAGHTQKREDSWYKAKKTGTRAAKLQGAKPPEEEVPDTSSEKSQELERGKSGRKGKGGSSSGDGPDHKANNSPMKGRVTYLTIPIRPQLYFLYLAAMAQFEELDDTPECFGEWLTFCVFKLYALFPRVFGVDKLIAHKEAMS